MNREWFNSVLQKKSAKVYLHFCGLPPLHVQLHYHFPIIDEIVELIKGRIQGKGGTTPPTPRFV